MINVLETQKRTTLWVVSQKIEEMLYPQEATFISRESSTGKKLTFITLNGSRLCCPTHLLFTTKQEALIYGSVNFLKLYYSFDPFFLSEDISESMLIEASTLVEKYEEEDPAKFLFHWMGNVPGR
ncbi:MAG: hypothetical protein DRH57_06220 [Candidatus Cloacimonadota bacterium]|nr:MAG: hypothetical protein DRH57_06220 [Candidatus Cloacimonadota bacterium]